MKKFIYSLLTIFMFLSITACSSTETTESKSEDVEEKEEVTYIAEYDDYTAEITGGEFTEKNGVSAVQVHFHYQNNNEDSYYLYESFSIKAFQDDTELNDLSDINDGSQEEKNLIVEVKNGSEIDCDMYFETTSDNDVEIQICTPTGDEDVLVTYTISK